jgi:hypothetical protein
MNGAENPTEPVAAQAGVDALLSNRRDWKYHAQRINAAWSKRVEGVIETGQALIDAAAGTAPRNRRDRTWSSARAALAAGAREGATRMTMNVIRMNERFERIERAYTAALAGRDPETVNIVELVPAIYAAVPDTSTQQIVEALRWSARKDLRGASELEHGSRR